MKTKLLPLLTFFLFPCFSNAQIAFEKTFGTPSNFDGFIGGALTPDGNILAVGTTATLGEDNFDILIHKFTPEGNLVSLKTWDNGGHDEAHDFIELSTGGYIIVGNSQEGSNQQLLLLKINENGEEIWSRKIGNEYPENGLKITELNNGELVVAGNSYNDNGAGNTSSQQTIWHLSNDGNEINQFPIPTSLNLNFGITTLPDNSILLMKNFYEVGHYNLGGALIYEGYLYDSDGIQLFSGDFSNTPDGTAWVIAFSSETDSYLLASLNEDREQTSIYPFENNLPIPYTLPITFQFLNNNKILIGIGTYSQSKKEIKAWCTYDIQNGEYDEIFTIEEYGVEGNFLNPTLLAQDSNQLFLFGNTFSPTNGHNAEIISFDFSGNLLYENTVGQVAPHDFERGYEVIQTDDEGYIILGTKFNEETNQDTWLLRTNSLGEVIWTNSYGNEENIKPQTIKINDNGEIFILGTNSGYNYLTKVKGDGTIIWQRKYLIGANFLGFAEFAIDTNDEIFLTSSNNGLGNAKILHLSPEGDSLNLMYVDNNDILFRSTYGIELSNDGNILLSGEVKDIEITTGLVMKIDKDGNKLEELFIGDTTFGAYSMLRKIEETENNEIFVSGHYDFYNSFVLKLDEDFQVEYEKIIPTSISISGKNIFRDPAENGNPVIFNYKSHPNKPLNYNHTISKYNEDNELLFEAEFGQDISGRFAHGIKTMDGGYAAIGYAEVNKSEDIYFVKTLSDGTVDWEVVLTSPFDLNISPNPTSTFINYKLDDMQLGPFSVRIFTKQGNLLISENHVNKAGNFNGILNVADLPTGTYYLQVLQGGKSMTSTFVRR